MMGLAMDLNMKDPVPIENQDLLGRWAETITLSSAEQFI